MSGGGANYRPFQMGYTNGPCKGGAISGSWRGGGSRTITQGLQDFGNYLNLWSIKSPFYLMLHIIG